MMQQAQDFLDESEALHILIADLTDEELRQATAFKNWTIETIIRHLHVWNEAANMGLTDEEQFKLFIAKIMAGIQSGGLPAIENEIAGELRGRELVATWSKFFREMTPRFGAADPSDRVLWAGPTMSVRSSITARLMETWAHGQEIYDLLGVTRKNEDRIRNIVVLGNNTYGWTFKVNGEDPPEPHPHLILNAPSGDVWLYNDPNGEERIEGLAEEFCQVVTQTRNIADTDLKVAGPNATRWMAMAQCFAGRPETPPAPGTRKPTRP